MIYGKPIWDYNISMRLEHGKRIVLVALEFDKQSFEYVEKWGKDCHKKGSLNNPDLSHSVELRRLLNPFAKFYGIKLFSLESWVKQHTSMSHMTSVTFRITEKTPTYLEGIQSAIADILTNK